jgi:16S rRNA (uracil1498-N3)-methyltransferase
MSQRRFYVPPEDMSGEQAIIRGKQAHHLISVLRKKQGDEIVIFDGEGTECAARILRIGRSLVVARVRRREVHEETARPVLALYAAVPKGRKFDIIVEGATELGADSITPLLTERTVVKLEDWNVPTKLERWRRIAVAAAKQCRRSTLPRLRRPVAFSDAVQDLPEWAFPILACPTDSSLPLYDVLQEITSSHKEVRLYVGPEGGFSPEEIEAGRNAGMRLVSLGENILRTETAALASLSVVNCFLDSRVGSSALANDGEK